LKTEAIGDRLREALSTLGDIRVAFIYGSTAKGTEVTSSDIDLMVIGEIDLDILNRTIDNVEDELGRTVNYTLFSAKEHEGGSPIKRHLSRGKTSPFKKAIVLLQVLPLS